MDSSETFGIEHGFAEKAIEWMNDQGKKRKSKFEARLYNYEITTQNFGKFEMFSWIGDVKEARRLIIRASKHFKMRVIEGGYKPKDKAGHEVTDGEIVKALIDGLDLDSDIQVRVE